MIARMNETKLLVRPPVFTDCPKHLRSMCNVGPANSTSRILAKRECRFRAQHDFLQGSVEKPLCLLLIFLLYFSIPFRIFFKKVP